MEIEKSNATNLLVPFKLEKKSQIIAMALKLPMFLPLLKFIFRVIKLVSFIALGTDLIATIGCDQPQGRQAGVERGSVRSSVRSCYLICT
jgi:hypothetical protein